MEPHKADQLLGEWGAWENVSTGASGLLGLKSPALKSGVVLPGITGSLVCVFCPTPFHHPSVQAICPGPCLIGIPQSALV